MMGIECSHVVFFEETGNTLQKENEAQSCAHDSGPAEEMDVALATPSTTNEAIHSIHRTSAEVQPAGSRDTRLAHYFCTEATWKDVSCRHGWF